MEVYTNSKPRTLQLDVKLSSSIIFALLVFLLCPVGLFGRSMNSRQVAKAVRGRLKTGAQPPGMRLGRKSEFDDHTIDVALLVAEYCGASSDDCYEYISRVRVGSIDNSSDCNNYADYTSISTGMQVGTGYPVTVTNGGAFPGDQCGIWVDWNQDMVFNDANEQIAVADGPETFTATITPPNDANLGDTRNLHKHA